MNPNPPGNEQNSDGHKPTFRDLRILAPESPRNHCERKACVCPTADGAKRARRDGQSLQIISLPARTMKE
jgi:hypothetical protein